MKKTTKEIGKSLENYILEKLKIIEPNARLTKGSGNKNEKGDVLSQNFLIECKKRNTESFTIDRHHWIKLLGENISGEKIPFLATENELKERLITLDVEDFFKLMYELFELREDIESEKLKFRGMD